MGNSPSPTFQFSPSPTFDLSPSVFENVTDDETIAIDADTGLPRFLKQRTVNFKVEQESDAEAQKYEL